MKNKRLQTALYVLTSLALAFSLMILIWLHQVYVNNRNRAIDDMKGLFSRDEIIKPPYDLNFQFRKIESLARTVKSNLFVKNVYVAKIIEGKGEHVIYPFHVLITDHDWKKTTARWQRVPLSQGDQVYAVLYIEEDKTPLNTVRAAIGLLGLLLLVTLGLLLSRLITQQSELQGAYGELAEKDRQMIHLERLALAGQLTANILHDIKKPVANIKHTLPEMEAAAWKGGEGNDLPLKNIKAQTELFFAILKDLGLERFVRSKDLDKEYLDLNNVLRQSCALVQYEKKAVEIVWNLDTRDSPLVLAPPYRLIQVFSNLILNAYQAMDGAGRLTLTTSLASGFAIMEIADDGPGVDVAMAQRLFNPFETTKPEGEGTGLGLYISRNIIADLGGRLELVAPGPGATFRVSLPAVPSQ